MTEKASRHSFRRSLCDTQQELPKNQFGQTVIGQNGSTIVPEENMEFVMNDGSDPTKGFTVQTSILNSADSVLNKWLDNLPEDKKGELLNQLGQFKEEDVEEIEEIPETQALTIHDECIKKIDELDDDEVHTVVKVCTNVETLDDIEVEEEIEEDIESVVVQKVGVGKKSCKKCHSSIPTNAKFCPECGVPQFSKYCIECGYEFKDKEKFCPECGQHR